jgi:hypothetical protein
LPGQKSRNRGQKGPGETDFILSSCGSAKKPGGKGIPMLKRRKTALEKEEALLPKRNPAFSPAKSEMTHVYGLDN